MTSSHKSKSSLSAISERIGDGSHYQNCASSKPSASVIYRKPNIYNQAVARPSVIQASSDVRQRVLSARRLKIKSYQNQLAEAKQTIEDLLHENKLLQTLHKRQDTALAKYESSNAELPQLLNAHSEELRIWQTKCKNLQITNKELENKLKQKESIILSLTDQNKYYSQLNKDKNLQERQQLREENECLIKELNERKSQINNLKKKMELEVKNLKLQVQNEQRRARNANNEIEKYRGELHAFNKLDQFNMASVQNKKARDPNKNELPKPTLSYGDSQQTKIMKSFAHPSHAEHGDGDASVKKIHKKNVQQQPRVEETEAVQLKEKKVMESMPAKPVLDIIPPKDDINCNTLENFEEIDSYRSEKLSENDFNTKRMRTDITNIRAQLLGDDYERREEFIDGFCIQQSLKDAADDEENEEKYRSYTKNKLQLRQAL